VLKLIEAFAHIFQSDKFTVCVVTLMVGARLGLWRVKNRSYCGKNIDEYMPLRNIRWKVVFRSPSIMDKLEASIFGASKR